MQRVWGTAGSPSTRVSVMQTSAAPMQKFCKFPDAPIHWASAGNFYGSTFAATAAPILTWRSEETCNRPKACAQAPSSLVRAAPPAKTIANTAVPAGFRCELSTGYVRSTTAAVDIRDHACRLRHCCGPQHSPRQRPPAPAALTSSARAPSYHLAPAAPSPQPFRYVCRHAGYAC